MDDEPNIIQNDSLHIQNLNFDSIRKTFFSDPSHNSKLYRPIACLSFAINWYFGKGNVTGYHIVNIFIHILTAFILFLTILALFESSNLKDKYHGSEYFIALLAVALWAINPIQTQGVTYIVQRMASMAAMFYLLGIYFFVKARIHKSRLIRVFLYAGCFFSFVFALGSKENAITFPLALLLVEIIFFQNFSFPKTRRKLIWISAVTGVSVVILGAVIFLIMKGDPVGFIQNLYKERSFTPLERLMTEPRILVCYITQIFYPVPTRLSIEHDVVISTSLMKPWTTLPAILMIFSLFGLGISQIRKKPIIAFGILFFFLNHLIESTIIPLELVFEHRNYLPSLFVFFPVAAALKWQIDYYYKQKRSMALIVISFIIFLLIGLGTGTYIRNQAWATEKNLWEDAMKKAPGSARPAYNMAKHYYHKVGLYDQALELYTKSLKLNASKPGYSQAMSLNGMASIYYMNHEYEKVIKLCEKALKIDPEFETAQYNLVLTLLKAERWDEASGNADLLLSRSFHQKNYLNLKSLILIKQNKPEEALQYLKNALRLSPNCRDTLINIGMALNLTGNHKNAEWFLRRAARNSPGDMLIYFCLIENSVRAGDESSAGKYTEKLLASFSLKSIQNELERLPGNHRSVPVSRELIAPMIKKKLTEACKEVEKLN